MQLKTKLSTLICVVLLLFSCSTSKKLNEPFYEENSETNLFVFVGEKISVDEFDPNQNSEVKIVDSITGDTVIKKTIVMDSGFNCKYRISQKVFNDLGTDTVKFKAYDHYGRPPFEKYDYVLLYISKNKDGSYYHQKYQFDPLVRKENNFSGLKGETIESLFNKKKSTVLTARGLFK